METVVAEKEKIIRKYIEKEILPLDSRLVHRGIGLIHGIDLSGINPKLAIEGVHKAFDKNVILEVAGRHDGTLKIMPPLTIEENVLVEGLEILKSLISELVSEK